MNRFCCCIRRLVPLTVLLALLASCNSMKKVPAGESLLTANKAKVIGKGTVSKKDVLGMVVQEPNSKFFGARVKLSFYNWSKDSVDNWWNNRLRKTGEKPVIFDSLSIGSSLARITGMAGSKGYFNPIIEAQVKRHGKDMRKVKVIYTVTLDEPYHIRMLTLNVRDDSLKDEFANWKKETLLKDGMQYDVSALNKERGRITQQLQNNGYWAFNKDYINYRVDSAVGNRQMDVELRVSRVNSNVVDSATGRTIRLSHKKYRIGNVYLEPVSRVQLGEQEPVYDTVFYENISRRAKRRGKQGSQYYIINRGKPVIRYKPVIEKTYIENGKMFSARHVSDTYDHLGDIRVFQYTDVALSERPYDTSLSYFDNNVLDCKIRMLQGNRFGFSVEGQFTTSSGIQGISAAVGFQDRNIFGGGEIFNIKAYGLYEFQVSGSKETNRKLLNTFEVKGEVSLEFPRFLFPVSRRLAQRNRPTSILAASYSYQSRRDYSRGIFNLTFGYHWKNGRFDQTLNPVEVGTVQMLKTSDGFKSILEHYKQTGNNRLLYQYSDHFILTPRYQFTYNSQQPGTAVDFDHVIINAELAGSLLYGFFSLSGPKPESGYKILGLPFSQYARLVLDYRHHFVFGLKTELVLRASAGVAYSYGNSRSVPYEKSLFIGGNSTLRAWPLYGLGPGSFVLQDKRTFERLGDVMMVFNLEQRFPIISGLRGAVFVDVGNIWMARENEAFAGGDFKWNRFYKEFAVGTGVGLRYDFKFFLIRVDMGIPLRDPSKLALGERNMWVIQNLKWKDLMFNFGIGYPF